jgi:hypothetical protein
MKSAFPVVVDHPELTRFSLDKWNGPPVALPAVEPTRQLARKFSQNDRLPAHRPRRAPWRHPNIAPQIAGFSDHTHRHTGNAPGGRPG